MVYRGRVLPALRLIGAAMDRSEASEAGKAPIPRWLRFVLASDRAGSAWYIGTGFFLDRKSVV